MNSATKTLTSSPNNPEDLYYGGGGIFGIGFSVDCRPYYNALLNNTSEFDKLEAAVASTLMTLVPVLLSFAPLPTARIGSLIHMSTLLALFTAAMTLGLYSKGKTTLAKISRISAKDLCIEETMLLYGGSVAPAGGEALLISAVQELYKPRESSASLSFPRIKQMVQEDYDQRPLRYQIFLIVVLFSTFQYGLFVMLTHFLPRIEKIISIWSCFGELPFYAWLVGAALLSGLIRTLVASRFFAKNEVFHLTPLPPSYSLFPCKGISIFTPEYWKLPIGTPQEHRRFVGIDYFAGDLRNLWRMIRAGKRGTRRYLNPQDVFIERPHCPHPMVIIIQLAEESEPHPLTVGVFGYFQALVLVFLTFLFGSFWGGTLFWTLGFVVTFLTIIAVSRISSLWVGSWMEKRLNVIVINCENETERSAITRILLAMPRVLVESITNDYKYSERYRIDTRCTREHDPTGEVTGFQLRRAIGLVWGFIGCLGVSLLVFSASHFILPSYSFFLPSWTLHTLFLLRIFAGCICGVMSGLGIRSEIGVLTLEDIGSV